MSFLRKNGLVIAVGIAVLATSTLVLLLNNAPQDPKILYKATQPAPKPSEPQTNTEDTVAPVNHAHEHGHDTTSHSHTVEKPPSKNKYDWRHDSVFNRSQPKVEPWKQTYPEDKSVNDTDDIYPPRDWYKTEDSELFAQYMRAQLIKQFGDIPAVHTFTDLTLKERKKIPLTYNEYTDFLKAQYSLWPSPNTLRTLKHHRERKAR